MLESAEDIVFHHPSPATTRRAPPALPLPPVPRPPRPRPLDPEEVWLGEARTPLTARRMQMAESVGEAHGGKARRPRPAPPGPASPALPCAARCIQRQLAGRQLP